MNQAVTPAVSVKQVSCPSCKGVSVYAASNPFRPFCCERCKHIDLGDWASERFAMPVVSQPDDNLPDMNH